MTLQAVEFVRRFAMHVVPGGLVRIRQYGLLANRGRGARLGECRRLLSSVASSASTATPSCSHDYRGLILMTLLLATATPAALAPLSEQWPNVPACAICGSALRTLWQAPRPRSHKLPTLACFADQDAPPVREDSS
jgi:hypothetical protein